MKLVARPHFPQRWWLRNKNNVVGFDFYQIQPNPSHHARHAEGAEVNRNQKFSRSENTLLVGLKQIMG